MDTEIILGYWNIRGLAQVPRLLLSYTKANWKNKIYTDRDSWFNKDKKNIGFTFPNLPYLIEGNLKITQSSAIQRYIINRSNHKELLGKDIKDQAIVDNLLGICSDIRAAYTPLYFSEQYKEEVKAIPQKIEKKLQYVQNFYGDKQFALGYLTLVDFVFAQISYYLRQISEQLLYNKFPFLDRVHKAVQALPQIQAYYNSQGAIRQPFTPDNSNLKPKIF